MTKVKSLLCTCFVLGVITSCGYEPPEQVHFRLEKDFLGLIQIVVDKDGLRPSQNRHVFFLDIPSSGVLHVSSWPSTYQLSGSKSGELVPTENSGSTSTLPKFQKGLRNMGTTTLGDGTILLWFFLGTEEDTQKTRNELREIAPRYLEYSATPGAQT